MLNQSGNQSSDSGGPSDDAIDLLMRFKYAADPETLATPECLTADEIRVYLQTGRDRSRVVSHLARCSICSKQILQMKRELNIGMVPTPVPEVAPTPEVGIPAAQPVESDKPEQIPWWIRLRLTLIGAGAFGFACATILLGILLFGATKRSDRLETFHRTDSDRIAGLEKEVTTDRALLSASKPPASLPIIHGTAVFEEQSRPWYQTGQGLACLIGDSALAKEALGGSQEALAKIVGLSAGIGRQTLKPGSEGKLVQIDGKLAILLPTGDEVEKGLKGSPDLLSSTKINAIASLAGNGDVELISPDHVAVRTREPELRWKALSGPGVRYQVLIETNEGTVAKVPSLPTTDLRVTVGKGILAYGQPYAWRVVAFDDNGQPKLNSVGIPIESKRGKFLVLDEHTMEIANKTLSDAGISHLERGLYAAKIGLFDDALSELALVKFADTKVKDRILSAIVAARK